MVATVLQLLVTEAYRSRYTMQLGKMSESSYIPNLKVQHIIIHAFIIHSFIGTTVGVSSLSQLPQEL